MSWLTKIFLFLLFRLIRGFEGSYVEFRSNTRVIESHFRKIMLDPLTKDELKKVSKKLPTCIIFIIF